MIELEVNKLRHTQPCGKGEMQHGTVPDTEHRFRVRRIQESLQLIAREVTDERLIGLLHGNCMDSARLIEAGRQSVLQETEERVDRGEPDVTSSRRVGARSLKMLQERQDERRIKPLDLNLRRLTLSRREAKQSSSWKACAYDSQVCWLALRSLGRCSRRKLLR